MHELRERTGFEEQNGERKGGTERKRKKRTLRKRESGGDVRAAVAVSLSLLRVLILP
jgi:hypothetical protein